MWNSSFCPQRTSIFLSNRIFTNAVCFLNTECLSTLLLFKIQAQGLPNSSCRHCWATKSYLTLLRDPPRVPPSSSVHGVSQARLLEWVVIFFSGGSSQPGMEPASPALQSDSLPLSHRGSPPNSCSLKSLYTCLSFSRMPSVAPYGIHHSPKKMLSSQHFAMYIICCSFYLFPLEVRPLYLRLLPQSWVSNWCWKMDKRVNKWVLLYQIIAAVQQIMLRVSGFRWSVTVHYHWWIYRSVGASLIGWGDPDGMSPVFMFFIRLLEPGTCSSRLQQKHKKQSRNFQSLLKHTIISTLFFPPQQATWGT